MGLPLISKEEYDYLCKLGINYEGYVWTPAGKIFKVEKKVESVTMPFQTSSFRHSWRMPQGKTFFETIETPQITLESLGTKDILYAESGQFIALIEADDPVAGEIKILRGSYKYPNFVLENFERSDIVNITEITLTAEAYSEVFTHIISLIAEKELQNITNNKVSVELNDASGKKHLYNVSESNPVTLGYRTDAYYSQNKKIVTAILYCGNSDNLHLYSTIWNVMNNLGAHELLGHGGHSWWNDEHRMHHLVYLFQMGHFTWEKTTKEYKKSIQERLRNYYNDYRSEETRDRLGILDNYDDRINNPMVDFYNNGRSCGLYPQQNISHKDSVIFNDKLSRRLQHYIKSPFK